MSEDKWIGPVRPMFTMSDEAPPKTERILAGSNSGGMIIDVSKEGMFLNAYYTGLERDIKYSNLIEGVFISWEDLEKMKIRFTKIRRGKVELSKVEDKVDKEYLEALPTVTINSKKYYIDSVRRERRSVNRPEEVWRF